MLKTTKELIGYLQPGNEAKNGTIVNCLVNSILISGDMEDADQLLDQYLLHHTDFHHSYLLPVFKKFGDHSFAEKIFNLSIHQGKLMENADPDILELLGCLHCEPIRSILANYAFGNFEHDYYRSKSAILGLLNFDCSEYESAIKEELIKCYHKNLFPEFIPALVCKLKDRNAFLEPLFELGNDYASTDCNAGIILGFSLCGQEGEKYFKRLLFDPNWETYSGGTGTLYYTYKGLRNLGIRFTDLFFTIKKLTEPNQLAYSLNVFFALLEKRIDDYEETQDETFADIYSTLFKWNNESHDLTDLAGKVNKEDEANRLQRTIELKIIEEAIVKNYIH